MRYSDEFKRLVLDAKSLDFIGWGNPNSKILILGKEPAIDTATESGRLQYATEVAQNRQDWRENILNQTGFDDVFNKYSTTKLYGNPLYPHCWQKYQVRKRKNGILADGQGTARTWYQYQKLINMIIGKTSTRNDYLDFHKFCFSTDLSGAAALSNRQTVSEETNKSITERRGLFYSDFIRSFPIVIAAIGNYRDFVAEYFSGDGNHLVITTYQLSARISDKYLSKIANKIIDFAKKCNIQLLP